MSKKFDQYRIWLGWERVSLGLGGCWWFLPGNLEDGIIFDIIDHVVRWHERYTESLIKIRQDLTEKGYFGDLEDVDGSWLDTWRMGSSLTSYIMLLDDMGYNLKVWWRSDMNNLRKSYSPGRVGGRFGVGGWFLLGLRIGLSRSIWIGLTKLAFRCPLE